MTGINLSQSLQDKQAQAKGTFLDRGFFINITILLVTAMAYGGVHWYLGTLVQKIAAVQQKIDAKRPDLQGKEADRVADLQRRITFATAALDRESDPGAIFSQLEQATIAEVRLTKYEEKLADNKVVVEGVTGSLKDLARAVVAYRQAATFQTFSIDSVEYNKEGTINFGLSIMKTSPSTAASPSS